MLPNVFDVEKLDDYLWTDEAAAFIGVHPDTLRRWGNAGKLTVYRHPINRYRLYKKIDLQKLLQRVEVS